MNFEDHNAEAAEAFKLLANLFLREPDREIIENFQEMFQVEIGESPEEISDDFLSLFYDPEEHLLPYESAYAQVPDSPVVPDSVTGSVYNDYLKEGLILEDVNIVPDHLAAELFFIGYLVESKKKKVLRDFIERHVVQWVPRFCDDLYESSGTDFYREAASVTKDIILTEYEQLSAWE